MEKINYCSQCGAKTKYQIPEGEDRQRAVCNTCNFIQYQNPRVVVCTITIDDDNKILLAKRAIEPRKNYWTLPGGFLELNENTDIGALRETEEETYCTVKHCRLFSVIGTPMGEQIHMFYIAKLLTFSDKSTNESTEVKMFSFQEIPWAEISFRTVINTLHLYIKNPEYKGVYHGQIDKSGNFNLSIT